MSGLEALGVAANVVGVIGFGIQVASLCKAIYNGRSTNEEVLSDCTTSMAHASAEIIRRSDGWQPQGLVERELVNMARECHRIAKELESEVQYITSSYKRNSASSALKGTIRAFRRRPRLEELEKSLQSYKNTMETQILVHITSKIDQAEASQLQNMDNISKELQLLLSQAAAGRAQIDNANDAIIKALEQLQSAIATRLDTTQQQNQQDAITQAARQQFLQSFKFPEMNQRFNNILHPEDATLTQVFSRYRDLGSEGTKLCIHSNKQKYKPAGEVWFEFISWLQSDNRFFWIQGKPGSGKSTLVRYLISNNTTRKLLEQWCSETIILSHFVWKIGTPLQRSLQGLYCTLIHQLLSKVRDQSILDDLVVRFKEEASKDTVHDWPITQLKALLFSIFENFPTSVALFIDGLDEMCTKEQDGLIDFIDKIEHLPRVKLCVASRAEWQFRQRFCQVPTLKLHELMAADMEKFLQEKFHSFETKGFITKPMSSKIISLLLQKAQGVFLWLQLVTNSIKNGLLHKNCEQDLLLRLDQLPSDLEDLYIDMWKRSTEDEPIYRAQAAHYFNLVLTMTSLQGYRDCLLSVALANHSSTHSVFLDVAAKLPFSTEQLGQICEVTKSEIATRCFGLMEMQRVVRREGSTYNMARSLNGQHEAIHSAICFAPGFIHRTASDFLNTTELGQRILSFDSTPLFEIEDILLKAYMCTSRVLNQIYGPLDATPFSWQDGHSWLEILRRAKNPYELLHLTESFYYSGIMVLCDHRPPWYPKPLFLSAVARFPEFEEFVIAAVRKQQADLGTAVLRDIWAWDTESPYFTDSLQLLIARLHQAGANTLSNGVSFAPTQNNKSQLVPYGSPLSLFLGIAVDTLSRSLRLIVRHEESSIRNAALIQRLTNQMLETSLGPIDSTYRTCHFTYWGEGRILHGVRAIGVLDAEPHIRPFSSQYTAILDTNLAFLSSYILNLATCMQEINDPNIANAWTNASNKQPVLLCVLVASTLHGLKCYIPLEQAFVRDLIEWLLPGMHGMSENIHNRSPGTMDSLQNPSLYKEVDYATFITKLAKERVGFVSLEDAGVHPPNSPQI